MRSSWPSSPASTSAALIRPVLRLTIRSTASSRSGWWQSAHISETGTPVTKKGREICARWRLIWRSVHEYFANASGSTFTKPAR